MTEVTRILAAIEQGDTRAADELLPVVYDERRRLAASRLARETPGHTLQPTALVHEAYLRLISPDAAFDGRGHFFAAAAEAMRRILVERARSKGPPQARGRPQAVRDQACKGLTPDHERLSLANERAERGRIAPIGTLVP